MLPIVTEDLVALIDAQLQASPDDWKRAMVQRIKEDNPELNTLLLQQAQHSAHPKDLILGAYIIYCALELADRAQE